MGEVESSQAISEAIRRNCAPPGSQAIVTFSEFPLVESQLTWDRRLLIKAIEKIEKPQGGTRFWDALRYVGEAIAPKSHSSRRNAIVVMTDGVDNALPDVFGDGSRTTFEDLVEVVGRSDTIVFPIYLDTEEEEVKRRRNPRSAYAIARTHLALLADSVALDFTAQTN